MKFEEFFNQILSFNFSGIHENEELFTPEIISKFQNAISEKNADLVEVCVIAISTDGVNTKYIEVLKEALKANWHYKHEDLVELARELKDPKFIEILYDTALMKLEYLVPMDLEPLLRKCLHGLMEIDTSEAHDKVNLLAQKGNENVKIVLEMYR